MEKFYDAIGMPPIFFIAGYSVFGYTNLYHFVACLPHVVLDEFFFLGRIGCVILGGLT